MNCNIYTVSIDDGWEFSSRDPVVLDCLELSPGPVGEAADPGLTPFQCFKLLFNDDLFQYIVDQSNIYAEQNIPEGSIIQCGGYQSNQTIYGTKYFDRYPM